MPQLLTVMGVRFRNAREDPICRLSPAHTAFHKDDYAATIDITMIVITFALQHQTGFAVNGSSGIPFKQMSQTKQAQLEPK